MTMFNVSRRGMPGRCRSGRFGRHAGGTDEEFYHLSVRYARTALAVSWRKSRCTGQRDKLAGLMTMFGTCRCGISEVSYSN